MNYRIIIFPPTLNPLVGELFDEVELDAHRNLLSNLGNMHTLSLKTEDGNFWFLPKEIIAQSTVCIEAEPLTSLTTA